MISIFSHPTHLGFFSGSAWGIMCDAGNIPEEATSKNVSVTILLLLQFNKVLFLIL